MSHTDIWIIRHGETDWNSERRLQGWKDIPLNDAGIAQAQTLCKHLNKHFFQVLPNHVYTSDLQRAYHTALPYARANTLNITALPGLRERNYGILEGKHWTALKEYNATREENLAIELNQEEHQAESLQTFYDRIRNTLLELATQHPNETLLLISHGGAIDMMWRAANQLPPHAPRAFTQRNTSINRLQISHEKKWSVISWADASHLDEIR
ncbi:histidine phosphatase family protein [Advenella sp. WQ 585]|uniref:Histidine phosphatase family protein n=1 Tax=Advenella mandrilli TaxID=2800330 RepID=A0ABS1EC48_9BURK|nr:histidine phosphatase family protein [Advenella mandrilli]MBK1779621.1 histidine phosphatase family protein [Advenella mandrilli]